MSNLKNIDISLYVNQYQTDCLLKHNTFNNFISSNTFKTVKYINYKIHDTSIYKFDFLFFILEKDNSKELIYKINDYTAILDYRKNKDNNIFNELPTINVCDEYIEKMLTLIQKSKRLKSFIFPIIYQGDPIHEYTWNISPEFYRRLFNILKEKDKLYILYEHLIRKYDYSVYDYYKDNNYELNLLENQKTLKINSELFFILDNKQIYELLNLMDDYDVRILKIILNMPLELDFYNVLFNNSSITYLNFDFNYEIDLKALSIILLNNKNIKMLNIHSININNVEYLYDVLTQNISLESLAIADYGYEFIKNIINSLKNNSSILTFKLEISNFDNEHINKINNDLSELLYVNTTLQSLLISFNTMNADNQNKKINCNYNSLFKILENNTSLTSLKIYSCFPDNFYINDESINILSNSLEKNTTLTNLIIDCENINNYENIINSLKYNSTLTSLTLTINYNINDNITEMLQSNTTLTELNMPTRIYNLFN